VFEIIKNINVVFGKPVNGIKWKKSEKPPKDSPFKKQSIFFRYLPGKSLRLVMPSIPCTLGRVSLKVPSVCCSTFQVRQRMDLVPVRTFKLLKEGKSYIHKKDQMEGLTFLQVATLA
jgi:hypothetical protein